MTDANRAAVSFIDLWPGWPGPVAVLAGPAGSGKSHIGTIWRSETGAMAMDHRDLGRAVEHLAEGPAFLDDADAGELDETGLFHAINAARQHGTNLLITARLFPSAWGVSLPDLASRLKAASTVEIAEPDDALLAGVITKLFADRQVDIEAHVVQFLVRRMERSLASAIKVVDLLDRRGLEEKARITRAMASDLLNAMEQGALEV